MKWGGKRRKRQEENWRKEKTKKGMKMVYREGRGRTDERMKEEKGKIGKKKKVSEKNMRCRYLPRDAPQSAVML